MDTKSILETSDQTLAGLISFPVAVGQLLEAGVEYYHVDYASSSKTFYGIDGGVVSTPIPYEGLPAISRVFDAASLRANIRDSQLNGQKYRDFTRRAMAAGVQGYFAFLAGRRVVYWGGQGDQHIEWFPGAKSVSDGAEE